MGNYHLKHLMSIHFYIDYFNCLNVLSIQMKICMGIHNSAAEFSEQNRRFMLAFRILENKVKY